MSEVCKFIHRDKMKIKINFSKHTMHTCINAELRYDLYYCNNIIIYVAILQSSSSRGKIKIATPTNNRKCGCAL